MRCSGTSLTWPSGPWPAYVLLALSFRSRSRARRVDIYGPGGSAISSITGASGADGPVDADLSRAEFLPLPAGGCLESFGRVTAGWMATLSLCLYLVAFGCQAGEWASGAWAGVLG